MKRSHRGLSGFPSASGLSFRERIASAALLAALALAGCDEHDEVANAADAHPLFAQDSGAETTRATSPPKVEHPSDYLRATRYPSGLAEAQLASWLEQVPQVQQIEIPSSADDSRQKALFYDSGSSHEKPLLLVLHSWSTNYLQNIDIPLAQFAVSNDWVFMHPDFRGQNDGRAESTASDLAISDMQDALAFARERAHVDPSRIYLLGYSGGAMNALHLASRAPGTFAGVAAWVPVYDLIAWHAWNAQRGEKYADEIRQACGGAPEEGSEAYAACLQRSPRAHLGDVAGELSVLIAHGINDKTVPPDQALHAFNALAAEEDRVSEAEIEALMDEREVPETLAERSEPIDGQFPRFSEANADVLLHLTSGPAELVLFRGGHDMLYRPGLEWLARQQR